jgi:hypothetical protein
MRQTPKATVTPLDLRSPLRRSLALIDLENLTRGRSADDLAQALHAVLATAGLRPSDEVHVAVDTGLYSRMMDAVPPYARLWAGTGPDGADAALLRVAPDVERHRFQRLVVASGDGRAFAATAARARAEGMTVDLVIGTGSCARALVQSATRVHVLDRGDQ